MFAQLGSIIFDGLKSFNTLESTNETALVEHALIENKPKLQKVGQKLDTIQITIFFASVFCSVQQEIDALNNARQAVDVMPLIMGDGTFMGDFVIKTVKVKRLDTAPNGELLQAEVQLELVEFYTSDREASAESRAISIGIGMAINNPQLYNPIDIPLTTEAEVVEAFVSGNADASSSAEIMKKIGAVNDEVRQKAERIMQQMLRTGDSVGKVFTAINADPESEMYARTRALSVSCQIMLNLVSDVVTECQALINDVDAGNYVGVAERIVTLVQRGTEVTTRTTQLVASATSLSSLVVVQ